MRTNQKAVLLLSIIISGSSLANESNYPTSHHITEPDSGHCLIANVNGKVELAPRECRTDEVWKIDPFSGDYRLKWVKTSSCLDIRDGKNITVSNCSSHRNLRFSQSEQQRGKLKVPSRNLCLQPTGAGGVHALNCSSNADKQWSFTASNMGFILADNYLQPNLNNDIASVIEGEHTCQNFSADTRGHHKINGYKAHHQSQEMSHQYPDGSHTVFISHSSNKGSLKNGEIIAFKLQGKSFDATNDRISKAEWMSETDLRKMPSEEHPSGLAWLPAPNSIAPTTGYLFIAAEFNRGDIAIYQYKDHDFVKEIGNLKPTGIPNSTDVWLARDGEYHWLVAHNMNSGHGAAYRASTAELFNYGTDKEGTLNPDAFKFVNNYSGPKDTGCGKSLGQNGQLVKDNTGEWYVVHSYTSKYYFCGDGNGHNVVKAYKAGLDPINGFSVSQNNTPVAKSDVEWSSTSESRSADGASGFRVNKHGQLMSLFGAQFSHLSGIWYRSRLEECRSEQY